MRGSSQRRWMCVAAVVGLSACRQPNPEWLGPDRGGSTTISEGDPTTSASAGDSLTGGASTGGTDPSGSSPIDCAPAPIPGEGECPEDCTACDAGRCTIECDADDCEDESIACPDGWPCDIRCNGKDACKDAELECAYDRDCTIECLGESACEDASVSCGSGSCKVTCGPQSDVCDGLDVECGEADATVTCASEQSVTMDPASDACACEAIDCE